MYVSTHTGAEEHTELEITTDFSIQLRSKCYGGKRQSNLERILNEELDDHEYLLLHQVHQGHRNKSAIVMAHAPQSPLEQGRATQETLGATGEQVRLQNGSVEQAVAL